MLPSAERLHKSKASTGERDRLLESSAASLALTISFPPKALIRPGSLVPLGVSPEGSLADMLKLQYNHPRRALCSAGCLGREVTEWVRPPGRAHPPPAGGGPRRGGGPLGGFGAGGGGGGGLVGAVDIV